MRVLRRVERRRRDALCVELVQRAHVEPWPLKKSSDSFAARHGNTQARELAEAPRNSDALAGREKRSRKSLPLGKVTTMLQWSDALGVLNAPKFVRSSPQQLSET